MWESPPNGLNMSLQVMDWLNKFYIADQGFCIGFASYLFTKQKQNKNQQFYFIKTLTLHDNKTNK